jgi:hypothetical protein
MATTPVNVRIPVEHVAEMRRQAIRNDRRLGDEIRRAIRIYLDPAEATKTARKAA